MSLLANLGKSAVCLRGKGLRLNSKVQATKMLFFYCRLSLRESEELVPEATLLLMTFQWLMVHAWLMVSHNEFICISDLFATSSVTCSSVRSFAMPICQIQVL